MDAVPSVALLDVYRPKVIAVHELRGGTRGLHGFADLPVSSGDGLVGKLSLQFLLLLSERERAWALVRLGSRPNPTVTKDVLPEECVQAP